MRGWPTPDGRHNPGRRGGGRTHLVVVHPHAVVHQVANLEQRLRHRRLSRLLALLAVWQWVSQSRGAARRVALSPHLCGQALLVQRRALLHLLRRVLARLGGQHTARQWVYTPGPRAARWRTILSLATALFSALYSLFRLSSVYRAAGGPHTP